MSWQAIKEVFRNLFKRPETIGYPFNKRKHEIPREHRGLLYPKFDVCIGCTLCSLECPSGAISMENIPLNRKQNPKNAYPILDYSKCIFCYHCVYICPVSAYVTSNVFELADSKISTSLSFSLNTVKSEIK